MAGEKVLACAEKKLIGKTLSNGEISFVVSEKFYKGNEITERKLKKLLQEIGNVNLVGEKPVKIAMQLNLAEEKNILWIENIPHIQIFRI